MNENCNHDLNDIKNHTLIIDKKNKTMVENPDIHCYCGECGKVFKFKKDKNGEYVSKK